MIVNDNVDIILPEQVDNPPAGNIEPVVDNLALENVGANVVVGQEDGENAGVLVENHDDVVHVDANVGGMQVDPPQLFPNNVLIPRLTNGQRITLAYQYGTIPHRVVPEGAAEPDEVIEDEQSTVHTSFPVAHIVRDAFNGYVGYFERERGKKKKKNWERINR